MKKHKVLQGRYKNAGHTFRTTRKPDLVRKTHKCATTTSWTKAPCTI